MADHLTPHQMIEDLAAVKLPKARRMDVLGARAVLQAGGALPLPMVTELRRLYKRYSRQISVLHEAREAARHSQARKRLQLTEEEVKSRHRSRLEKLKKKLTDYGI